MRLVGFISEVSCIVVHDVAGLLIISVWNSKVSTMQFIIEVGNGSSILIVAFASTIGCGRLSDYTRHGYLALFWFFLSFFAYNVIVLSKCHRLYDKVRSTLFVPVIRILFMIILSIIYIFERKSSSCCTLSVHTPIFHC